MFEFNAKNPIGFTYFSSCDKNRSYSVIRLVGAPCTLECAIMCAASDVA